MHIDIVSVVPELMQSPLEHSIMKRAQEKKLFSYTFHSLREYGLGGYKSVDDYPYGGGGGMVMRCEPLSECLDAIYKKGKPDLTIYLSPDGIPLKQGVVNQLSLKSHLVLICGHYKGIDQRIRETYVDMEISIGDYVLSGGELAAAVLVDSVVRVIPGVIGDEMSALSDSFMDNLLAPPVYTRPENWRGKEVPEILRSGNDRAIAEWRHEMALQRTRERRPDLLSGSEE
jgi:tRNA (guanine37-N1)-methyltransferase